MKTPKPEKEKVPRKGFVYNDRFRMTVKEFGRLIVIDLNRGTAVLKKGGKKVEIRYEDDELRKPKLKPISKL